MTVGLSDVDVAQSIQQKLSSRLGPATYRMWFASARVEVDDGALSVEAPTRFAADWINSRFRQPLLEAAQQEIGPNAGVRVTAQAAQAAPAAPVTRAPAAARPVTRPAGEERRPILRHDLETFITGPSNELAYTAACRLAEGSDPRLHVLFIHGACGLGKTHLLQGLCRRLGQRAPSARICYTTGEQFTNHYIHAVRFNKLGEFRRRLRKLDLLAVDDVHFLASKPATQSEFLHTFNAIDLSGSRLVLASDAHPKLIEPMGDALISRFMCGMVVRIDPPDQPTRKRMVEALARRRGLVLMEGISEQVASHVTGSAREIEGALTRLAAVASLRPGGATGPIGQAAVHQALDVSPTPVQRRPVRIEQIVQVVCDRLMVDRAQLMSRSRHRRVVLARAAAIHLARKLTTMSYPELARALGRPNHSTVVTAAQRIQRQVRAKLPVDPADTTLASTTDQLMEHLHRAVLSQPG